MNQVELEIKCLLGNEANKDLFLLKLQEYGVDTNTIITPERQLNHYFTGGDIVGIYDRLGGQMDIQNQELLYEICTYGAHHSVRTRNILPGDHTLLVIKSSRGSDTSHNGVARTEFEYEFTDMSLEELDRVLLHLGREYLSKWSRIRTNYHLGDITICLDHNAGYGYLVECETILKPGEDLHQAEVRLRVLMEQLGIQELSQEKLEQMFTYYNKNWSDYYGTHRTFMIDSDGQVIRYGFDTTHH